MALVVDSCVLLDIALRDPSFGIPSALLLEDRRKQSLVARPVSIGEICPQFDGSAKGQTFDKFDNRKNAVDNTKVRCHLTLHEYDIIQPWAACPAVCHSSARSPASRTIV